MTDVLFYHLTESKLEDALPPLLDKSVERGWQVAVQTREPARRDMLDAHLWTYRDDSFLPHGTDEGEMPDKPAGPADRLAGLIRTMPPSASSSTARKPSVETYERVVFMFDGYDQEQLEGARAQWKKLKGEGHNLTYWQQTQDGRWEKKA